MKHTFALAGAVLAMLGGGTAARADVTLPHVFSSHMVLQRDVRLPVWGWAQPGEAVSVSLGDAPAVAATTGPDGKWSVTLPPHGAGGPFTLGVRGHNQVTVDDVLVGEVWLCSGQSNMQFTVGGAINAAQEIATADFPQIRQFAVPDIPAGAPVNDVNANWVPCSPQTAGGFTAAGFFMARELTRALKVPVGLINSSWGGTRIEPWIPREGFGMVDTLKPQFDQLVATDPTSEPYRTRLTAYLKQLDAWMTEARAALAAGKPLDPAPAYPTELKPLNLLPSPEQQLSTLHDGMIAPLVPYAIRGAIWYQGEANEGEGMLYATKMQALVGGWRKVWNEGDFPFYLVQIAPYNYGGQPVTILPEFWAAQQAAARTIPNAGIASTIDIGNLNDIHPKNKQEVGHRLALLALARTYHQPNITDSGPTYRSMDIEGDHIRLHFDNVDGGLASRDGKPLNWFQVIGVDTDFVDATATIDGDTVVVSSPNVKEPRAVTFGWSRDAEPNFMNKAGLPAYPFRAGQVPRRDYLALKAPEAKNFSLVYDLDLANVGHDIHYDVDNHAAITHGFDRVAYFMELQRPGEPVQYVYVSLDPFTKEITKIGIPTAASGASFQQKVSNVNVISNVPGIVNGTGLQGCNMEFWSNNYGPDNAANIPNASAALYDFGDQPAEPRDGYGCMQIHNYEARQTLFAVNHWVAGGTGADLGIGNSHGIANTDSRDWTFAGNAGGYTLKRLRILVHETK